jgi:hypothetical protein
VRLNFGGSSKQNEREHDVERKKKAPRRVSGQSRNLTRVRTLQSRSKNIIRIGGKEMEIDDAKRVRCKP